MENETIFIGIDVSKDHLDVAGFPLKLTWQFTNTAPGISKLLEKLTKLSPALIVMEPTGGLEAPVAAELAAAGLNVAVVNARQIRDYAKATGKLAKTDPAARDQCHGDVGPRDRRDGRQRRRTPFQGGGR